MILPIREYQFDFTRDKSIPDNIFVMSKIMNLKTMHSLYTY